VRQELAVEGIAMVPGERAHAQRGDELDRQRLDPGAFENARQRSAGTSPDARNVGGAGACTCSVVPLLLRSPFACKTLFGR
jgi:hypothetical protein